MNSPLFQQRVKPQDFTPNKINCGEASAVLREMPDECIDLIITDPPYLCNYRDRLGRRVANDNNPNQVLPAFEEMYRVLKDDSYCITFYGWSAIADFSNAWKTAGFRIVGQIVWPKSYTSSTGFMAYQHESAMVLAKGHPTKPARPIADVQDWHYTGNKSHPTEKSIDIITPLIRCFSEPNEIILDPFLGSGTTAVAAALLNRQYIGVELKEAYCKLAENRLRGVEKFRCIAV